MSQTLEEHDNNLLGLESFYPVDGSDKRIVHFLKIAPSLILVLKALLYLLLEHYLVGLFEC